VVHWRRVFRLRRGRHCRAEARRHRSERGRQLFAASDNLSFAKKGIVAHSISAGSLHQDYHKPTDEVSRINLAHMTSVIRGLKAVVLDMADRDESLRWTDEGTKVLDRLGSR
jgi:Peptidase family M28